MTIFALILTFSISALAQCELAYHLAAKKRETRNNLVALGVLAVVPVLNSVALSGVALAGGVTYTMILNRTHKNTFGKVLLVLQGETSLIVKKVTKNLLAKDINVDPEDPHFIKTLAEAVERLSLSSRACVNLGFDETFNDEIGVYNFSEFAKIVTEEYLKLANES